MQPDPKFVERKIGGKLFRFETGRLAGQASGAVMGQVGETTILATATTSSPRGSGDFFPLTVDIEEKMYAAGKIPGGFFRRGAAQARRRPCSPASSTVRSAPRSPTVSVTRYTSS